MKKLDSTIATLKLKTGEELLSEVSLVYKKGYNVNQDIKDSCRIVLKNPLMLIRDSITGPLLVPFLTFVEYNESIIIDFEDIMGSVVAPANAVGVSAYKEYTSDEHQDNFEEKDDDT
jgi:hypothetical protein